MKMLPQTPVRQISVPCGRLTLKNSGIDHILWSFWSIKRYNARPVT